MKSDVANMECCPHCGHDEFYRKTRLSGYTEFRYRFDGEDAENSHMHDGLNYKESKTAYCCACHKPIRNLVITK